MVDEDMGKFIYSHVIRNENFEGKLKNTSAAIVKR